MTATYDNTLPTDKDKARNALGDIDIANPLRQDEEYNAQISLFGLKQATANIARSLAAEYAQQPVSVNVPGATISFSDRVKTWLAIADKLDAEIKEAATEKANSFKTVQALRGCNSAYERAEYVRNREYW